MRIFSVSLLLVALAATASAQTAAPLDAVGPVPNYLQEQPVRSMHARW
jgi:hypothetical protein